MAGILTQLAISWLLTWFFQKKGLSVLGFRPTKDRLLSFLLFFAITALCCASSFILKMIIAKQQWQANPLLSAQLIIKGIWWNVKSVLFEELIFRGVVLYILIKRLGAGKSIVISAIAFGVYHWFSFGVFGNVVQMAIVFITTGLMGFVLAYAYAKTFSLYIPIAIHLGWNITQQFIFSQGNAPNGIFVQMNAAPFRTNSYVAFFVVTFLPMIAALLINFLLIRKRRQAMDNY